MHFKGNISFWRNNKYLAVEPCQPLLLPLPQKFIPTRCVVHTCNFKEIVQYLYLESRTDGRENDSFEKLRSSAEKASCGEMSRSFSIIFETLGKVLTAISHQIRKPHYHPFTDTRLWKTKHPRKRFQNFHQSCVLLTDRIKIHQSQPDSMTQRRLEGHTSGCNWWISIRSVNNTQD